MPDLSPRLLTLSVLPLAWLPAAPIAAQQPTASVVLEAPEVERGRALAPVTPYAAPRAGESAVADRQTHPALLTGAALLGGTAGFFAGGLVGGSLACSADDPDDFCGLIGGFWGAAVGSTVGIPLAVHLANGRRGHYGRSQLVSAGIAAGLIGTLLVVENQDTAAAILLPLVPAAQIVSSILIERGSARGHSASGR